MPIDPVKLAALQALTKPKRAEYLAVYWDADDDTQDRYYSNQAYNQLAGYLGIGHSVEARILSSPFHSFEFNPDIRTETINITFDDIDKTITQKFQTFGSGIRCEFFYYYPDVDLTVSMWFGQLQAPQIYGWRQITTTATNGFRSRELLAPGRMRPGDHCAFTFGGHLHAEAIRTNGCGYDRGSGGTTGLLNGAVPFTDCLRDEASCTARFGDLLSYGGFDTDASATVSDGRSGYIARSKGNESALKTPIRVIAGTKHVRGLQLLLWRRELNANTPDHGWVAGVYEVGEGPNKNIRNIKVKEKAIEQMHLSVRNGTRRQPAVANYNPGGTISNFSKTGHFSARYGWTNPLNETPQTLQAECDCDGYREVAVFNTTQAGNGIIGSYYADQVFTDLVGVRVDSNVNFPVSTNAPMEGIGDGETEFCVRWEGFITAEFSETYTFEITHDDGVKLWIDGDVVIDSLAVNGTHTGTHAMTADTPVAIRIDFLQSNVAAPNPWTCILRWSSASVTPKVVIPNDALTHNGSSGFVRQWTNDRAWWGLELHTNQTFGLAYDSDRFNTDSFVETSYWGIQTVNFALVSTDGETKNFAHRRTTFDAILEGRPAAEQIADIFRSGAMAIPFQHDGEYMTRPLRLATAGELAAAKVFTDRGQSKNIFWLGGNPAVQLSQIPNDKLTNEITLLFEAADNFDQERPVTVRDPFQQLLAGRSLGVGRLQSVPMRFAAFGCRNLNEVIKLGYRLLRFGQFDEGGSQNNLRATIFAPIEQCLGLKKYDVVKLDSLLLSEFTIGTNDGTNDWTEGPQYFRVMMIKPTEGGEMAEVVMQAYNHTAMTAFETITNPNPEPPGPTTPSPNPGPVPIPCVPAAPTVTFNETDGTLELDIPNC